MFSSLFISCAATMLLKDPYFTQDVFSYMAVTELVEVCPRVSRLWMHAMVLHFWVKNPFDPAVLVMMTSPPCLTQSERRAGKKKKASSLTAMLDDGLTQSTQIIRKRKITMI